MAEESRGYPTFSAEITDPHYKAIIEMPEGGRRIVYDINLSATSNRGLDPINIKRLHIANRQMNALKQLRADLYSEDAYQTLLSEAEQRAAECQTEIVVELLPALNRALMWAYSKDPTLRAKTAMTSSQSSRWLSQVMVDTPFETVNNVVAFRQDDDTWGWTTSVNGEESASGAEATEKEAMIAGHKSLIEALE